MKRSRRRLDGWPRWLALRRITSLVLVLAAGALAVLQANRDTAATVPMLVAARDLAPGMTLRAADVEVTRLPASLRPPAALTSPREVAGRVLASATTVGEPLTRVRLIGVENSRLAAGGSDVAAVPFRLSDPAVADLLTPGAAVDVVTVEPDDTGPWVLAADATVLTVRRADDDARLVVLALPREEATRVAAAALDSPVTVTLR
ncbi:SAF domain-containing protein [Actinophytocola oryzae]|uniref:Flp pilus assembly protein CpaB n=1 Tax=Actinophytocola oryzae TaxID=502181 RepID=A0A4R7V8Z6_9PSEU|nr:SAF domain-containing protein [Actinophytocola oryzae]TDV45386.1 Flp pilus assembly protein CpaB [Actinophytocola oryzae]